MEPTPCRRSALIDRPPHGALFRAIMEGDRRKSNQMGDFRYSAQSYAASMSDANMPQGVGGVGPVWAERQRPHNGRKATACSVDFAHMYTRALAPTAEVIN